MNRKILIKVGGGKRFVSDNGIFLLNETDSIIHEIAN